MISYDFLVRECHTQAMNSKEIGSTIYLHRDISQGVCFCSIFKIRTTQSIVKSGLIYLHKLGDGSAYCQVFRSYPEAELAGFLQL